uniref:phosphotriesterase family protein n=1 Tax=uncultured Draconibacterium sp. TaxID=1573823 RepID=UPI003217AAC4
MLNIRNLFPVLFLLLLLSCNKQESKIITVTGEIPANEIGKTLHHEHLLVDFIGADSTGYHRWNKTEVIEKVLPFLLEIKELGYKTLVECTPEYLGRDPELLKLLSEKSGIRILTNVGYYSAINAKFMPKHAFSETPRQLADRWIAQAQNGIEQTGVYPGFIKIAVERAPLKEINKKVVEAACITHKTTGLTIMSHTGLAVPAFQQLEILKEYGIHPSAFIWTHANNEKDNEKHLEAARMGAWIAFDKFSHKNQKEFVEFALFMKQHDLLKKLLFSHDGGWYKPGEPNGGNFNGFTDIENLLIPALLENGLTQTDINQLFVQNPSEAFKISKRLIGEMR